MQPCCEYDHDPKRCAGHRRDGRPCGAWPLHGSTVCRMHGGSAPQVRRKARERVAVERARRMTAVAGVDLDPIDHLLGSLHQAAALVTAYGEMVADLDNAAEVDLSEMPGVMRGEVWWEVIDTGLTTKDGAPIRRRVPRADRLIALNREGLAHLHPFVVEFHRLIEVRAKLAKLAIDAGVREREVRLAEQQGQLIAQAVRGMLSEFGVDIAAHDDAPGIIRRHLQAVTSSAA